MDEGFAGLKFLFSTPLSGRVNRGVDDWIDPLRLDNAPLASGLSILWVDQCLI
jgi:hypothetical protein